jgi:hypothetical protein
MMFGGAAFAATSFSGIAGSDTNDPSINWNQIDDTETTDWQLIAA